MAVRSRKEGVVKETVPFPGGDACSGRVSHGEYGLTAVIRSDGERGVSIWTPRSVRNIVYNRGVGMRYVI